MADEKKPDAERANLPATQDHPPEPQPGAAPEGYFRTAAEEAGMTERLAARPTPGLSYTPGLRELPNSKVPGLARGEDVAHVYGPQQSPVDPIAAGLDVNHDPVTRAENRVITRTGDSAAGPRPHTYLEKTGPRDPVQQAAPADGSSVQAPSDEEAEHQPGPSSAPITGP